MLIVLAVDGIQLLTLDVIVQFYKEIVNCSFYIMEVIHVLRRDTNILVVFVIREGVWVHLNLVAI